MDCFDNIIIFMTRMYWVHIAIMGFVRTMETAPILTFLLIEMRAGSGFVVDHDYTHPTRLHLPKIRMRSWCFASPVSYFHPSPVITAETTLPAVSISYRYHQKSPLPNEPINTISESMESEYNAYLRASMQWLFMSRGLSLMTRPSFSSGYLY